jgi:ketosteroid isomerase-like protein
VSANLDLVHSIYAAWERGDFTTTERLHPEIEFVMVGGPSPGTWTGLAGMAEATHEFLSAWEDFRAEAEEYRELDSERVLVLTHTSGHARTSGLDVGQLQPKGANLFHIHDGKVTRLVAYLERDLAFADLGLEDQAVHEESTMPDLVRRGIEALNRRDFDALLRLYAPDAELDFNAWGIGTFKGHAAIRSFVEDWLGSYETYRDEADEILDLGHGVVFVAYRERARLAGTEANLERRQAYVASLQPDGLVERQAWYTDIDEARAAAERLAQERG